MVNSIKLWIIHRIEKSSQHIKAGKKERLMVIGLRIVTWLVHLNPISQKKRRPILLEMRGRKDGSGEPLNKLVSTNTHLKNPLNTYY